MENYTVKEAAYELGISTRQLQRDIKAGKLKIEQERKGCAVFIPADEIELHKAKRKPNTTETTPITTPKKSSLDDWTPCKFFN